MLEHDDVGSACTLPPPPPLLLLLLLPPPPPPHPAAAIASTANNPITPTALKLYFTLPPPSPVCANGVRSGGVSGLGRSDATPRERPSGVCGGAPGLVPWALRRSGGTGRRAGLKIRFPPGRAGSIPPCGPLAC